MIGAVVGVEFHNEFHILSHAAHVIAAHIDNRVFFKEAEGSGYNKVGVEFVQQDAGSQEGPLIFQHLESRRQTLGQAQLYQFPIFKNAVVGNSNHAAHRHHVAVLQHGDRDHG